MSPTAELADGRILEFPVGTSDDVIQTTVKRMVGGQQPAAVAEAPPEAPSLTESLIKEAPQTLGGIAGGLAVVGAAGAGVGLAPVIAGVGVGAAAAEGYNQLGQHLSGSPEAPKSSIEAAQRMGKALLTEAGYEAFGGFAAKGVSKILAPFSKRMIPEAKEAIAFFKDKFKPILFTSDEATNTRILDIGKNVAESSLIGGGRISDFKLRRAQFFDDFADSLIDQFGQRLPPDELGDLFVNAIEGRMSAFRTASEVLYNNVSDKIGSEIKRVPVTKEVVSDVLDASGRPITKTVTTFVDKEVSKVNIPTKRLKEFVKPMKIKFKDLSSIEAKNAGDDLVDAVSNLPNTLSFDAMKELRTRFLSRVDEFSVMNKKAPAIGKAKRMINLINESITGVLKEQAPDALEDWKTANAFYKHGQEQFNNTFIRRLLKFADDTGIGAEAIGPAVFKPGRMSSVRKVKAALPAKEWKKMQGFFMWHLLQKSADQEGATAGTKLVNNLTGKPGSFGMPMLKEILNAEQIKELKTFANALKLAQAKQGAGAGRIFIQLAQFGAAISLATGRFEAASAAIIFGPPVVAKMLLDPRATRLLTEGISISPRSPQAAGLMMRLIGAAIRIREEEGEYQ